MPEPRLEQITRAFLAALDVDLHLIQAKVLAELRGTAVGADFAAWAEQNPLVFGALVRGLSVLVHQMPHDGGLARETVADQLRRLPVEFHRAVLNETTEVTMKHDADFQHKFNEALDGLTSAEEVERVLRLSPSRRQEWLSLSPTARSVQLKIWYEEKSFSEQVDALSDRMEARHIELKEQREERRRRRQEERPRWWKRFFLAKW